MSNHAAQSAHPQPRENEPLRALVTGAASGIGAAVAKTLIERGDRVVGVDRTQFELPGGETIVADLAHAEARAALVEAATTRMGGVDVLVNVAGVFREGGIHNSGFDDWRPVWAVNLDAPIDLMRMLCPPMAERGFGRVVSITSVHARQAQPECFAYDVSKAALEAATRSAALDLGRRGVLVNAVAPGYVRTAMSVLPDGRDETETDDFVRVYVAGGKLPLGRGAQPNEIAEAVAFLASRQNTYTTGQVLVVDGGLSITF